MRIYFYIVHYTVTIDGHFDEYTLTGLIKAENPTKVRTLVCKELVKKPFVLIGTIHFEDICDLDFSLTNEKSFILTDEILPCEW
jgi:hypothetical protein